MTQGKTDCGLSYAVRRSGSSVGYCSLSIKCGTRDEEGFHNGIAHFVEHTIFKGTEKKSASVISSYLDRLGGELNAYTTKEEIVFHATVLKEDLSKAAGLLMELAVYATFPSKNIETEKGVVIDEIQSYKDSPADEVYDRFEEYLFAGHPLGTPILGTASTVKKMSTEELKAFVSKHFTPDRMAFSVVADIDESLMEARLRKLASVYFGEKPIQSTYTRKLLCTSGVLFDRTIDKRNHEVNAVIGATAPSLYEKKDRITAVLLANIIGGPASNSILNNLLREKNGWVYGVECGYTQYHDTGIMAISLGCDKVNLSKCLNTVDKSIDALKTAALSEAKLKAAKKQLIGQLAISSESGEAQCLSMGKSLLAFGHVATDMENRDAISAITSEDLMLMAGRIFDDSRLSRLIYL